MGDGVLAGRLRVRPAPSNSASSTECIQNGYRFDLNDGPVEAHAQDWYGVDCTTTDLTAWARADYRVRSPATTRRRLSSRRTALPPCADVCIPPPPPDLSCTDVPYRRLHVLPPDPHGFDADDDGIECEWLDLQARVRVT